LNNIEGHFGYF